MDKFFSQKTCDRCGQKLTGGRIMSMFNTDCICLACKEKEMKLPGYQAAQTAEAEAIKSGDMNFQGIGLNSDEGDGKK